MSAASSTTPSFSTRTREEATTAITTSSKRKKASEEDSDPDYDVTAPVSKGNGKKARISSKEKGNHVPPIDLSSNKDNDLSESKVDTTVKSNDVEGQMEMYEKKQWVSYMVYVPKSTT